jgi:hypothetical protein
MRFRERDEDERVRHNPAAGDPAGTNLEQLRRSGSEWLAAGDDAIRRGLSSDSKEFLKASPQESGQ